MPSSFKYIARDNQGKLITGSLEGTTVASIADSLLKMGLYPTDIKPDKKMQSLQKIGQSLFPQKISPEEQIMFTSRLSALLKAGIPISACIGALIDQTVSMNFRSKLIQIKAAIEDGGSLSAALSQYPEIFPDIYIAMLSAGEETGSIDTALDYLVEMLERELEIRNRITEITRYPKIVLGAMGFALVIIIGFVIPRYMMIFNRSPLELPIYTKALVNITQFVHNHWLIGLTGALIMYGLFSFILTTSKGRLVYDTWKLKTPATGIIILKLALARWANALGNLIKSGVPIIQALETSSTVTDNLKLGSLVDRCKNDVKEGSSISLSMKNEALIMPVVTQMVEAGEMSGTLDETLLKTSDFLEKEASRDIKALSSYVESGLVVMIGLIVLFLALAVFVPMWDLVKLPGSAK